MRHGGMEFPEPEFQEDEPDEGGRRAGALYGTTGVGGEPVELDATLPF